MNYLFDQIFKEIVNKIRYFLPEAYLWRILYLILCLIFNTSFYLMYVSLKPIVLIWSHTNNLNINYRVNSITLKNISYENCEKRL